MEVSVYRTALSELGLAVNAINATKPLWERRKRPSSPIIIQRRRYGVAKSIIMWTAKHTGIPVVKMTGGCKTQEIVHARWLAMWLIRNLQGLSTPAIGRQFRRDHTTVLHALSRVGDVYPDIMGITHRAAEELGLD